MPWTIRLRGDYDALELRRLAKTSRDNRQIRRLLALAAVYDGMSRAGAAQIGGMDRQTLRDWALRFNAEGPAGLRETPAIGPSVPAERGSDDGAGRDRRDRPRSGDGRCRALAADRPEAGDRGALRASSTASGRSPTCWPGWPSPISAAGRSTPGRTSA